MPMLFVWGFHSSFEPEHAHVAHVGDCYVLCRPPIDCLLSSRVPDAEYDVCQCLLWCVLAGLLVAR
jgi:hypothetical protein